MPPQTLDRVMLQHELFSPLNLARSEEQDSGHAKCVKVEEHRGEVPSAAVTEERRDVAEARGVKGDALDDGTTLRVFLGRDGRIRRSLVRCRWGIRVPARFRNSDDKPLASLPALGVLHLPDLPLVREDFRRVDTDERPARDGLQRVHAVAERGGEQLQAVAQVEARHVSDVRTAEDAVALAERMTFEDARAGGTKTR